MSTVLERLEIRANERCVTTWVLAVREKTSNTYCESLVGPNQWTLRGAWGRGPGRETRAPRPAHGPAPLQSPE